MKMKRASVFNPGFVAAWALLAVAAVGAFGQMTPTPELAARFQMGIDAFHKGAEPNRRKLKVVYFTPSDREPLPGHEERLTRILLDIQSFYREEMKRNGFTARTFPLEMEAGRLKLRHVRGGLPHDKYSYASGDLVRRDIRRTLGGEVDLQKDHVLILCGLCEEDEKGKFHFNSPYYGDGGSDHRKGHCFAADCRLLDTSHLKDTRKRIVFWEHNGDRDQTLAAFNSSYIGGVAHELGHGLGLPHNSQNRRELLAMGNALMGGGNHTYRKELWDKRGSFMTLASCLRLATHPLFTGSDRAISQPANTRLSDLRFEAEQTALLVSGRVEADVEAVGVIVYVDPNGGQNYDARTWVAEVVDGRFRVETNNWKPGGHALKVSVVHANGEVSDRRFPFDIDKRRRPDADGLNARWLLGEAEAAVYSGDWKLAEQVRASAREVGVSKERLAWFDHLVSLRLTPPPLDLKKTERNEVFVSDAKWRTAEVGWGRPARNHYHFDRWIRDGIVLTLGGEFQPKGLCAHAPAKHVFDLGGRWKTFAARIGLQEGAFEQGSGVFIIRGDGRELARSAKLQGASAKQIEADVTGVESLELIVESGKPGNANCWTIWGMPKLTR